jgi:hypothetical protein
MAVSHMAEAAPAGTRGECQMDSKASSRCRSRWTWGPLKSRRKGVGIPSSSANVARACTGGFRDDSDPPFLLGKVAQGLFVAKKKG